MKKSADVGHERAAAEFVMVPRESLIEARKAHCALFEVLQKRMRAEAAQEL